MYSLAAAAYLYTSAVRFAFSKENAKQEYVFPLLSSNAGVAHL